MKHIHDLIKRGKIHGNAGRACPSADQALNLRRDRARGGREISCRGLIAKSRYHPAAECLKSYLNGIVQTVVAPIVAPERNEHANLHWLLGTLGRLKFGCGTGQSNNDCTQDEAEQKADLHRLAIIAARGNAVKNIRCCVTIAEFTPPPASCAPRVACHSYRSR